MSVPSRRANDDPAEDGRPAADADRRVFVVRGLHAGADSGRPDHLYFACRSARRCCSPAPPFRRSRGEKTRPLRELLVSPPVLAALFLIGLAALSLSWTPFRDGPTGAFSEKQRHAGARRHRRRILAPANAHLRSQSAADRRRRRRGPSGGRGVDQPVHAQAADARGDCRRQCAGALRRRTGPDHVAGGGRAGVARQMVFRRRLTLVSMAACAPLGRAQCRARSSSPAPPPSRSRSDGPARARSGSAPLAAAVIVLAPIVALADAFRAGRPHAGIRRARLTSGAASSRTAGVRTLIGHGFGSAFYGLFGGFFDPQTPRSLVFQIWFDLGALGAGAFAAMADQAFFRVGGLRPALAPFLLAGLVAGLVICLLGPAAEQLWAFTLAGLDAIAYVLVIRGQFRKKRPHLPRAGVRRGKRLTPCGAPQESTDIVTDAAPSLTAHVAPIQAEEAVVAAAFLGAAPAFSLAHGVFCMPENAETRIFAHSDGALLCAASDGRRLVTGGDDGRLVATSIAGETTLIADESGKWIDAVALRADGGLAWSAGRLARARSASGETKTLELPSTSRGLAFLPKGYRLAVAHYNGVSLWFPSAQAKPETLDVERLASRRHRLSRRALRHHFDAGKHPARLAPVRRQEHAHGRLSGQDAVAVLVAGRQMAGDLRRRRLHPVAVPGQGRADGRGSARMRRARRRAGDPRRLPPGRAGRRRGL